VSLGLPWKPGDRVRPMGPRPAQSEWVEGPRPAASPGHSPRRAASGIRSAARPRLWQLRRAAPLAVVSRLTDGPTGVWLGEEPRQARERVVVSLVRGSCGIRVCGLPPWSQVPKPPRHSAGAAKRTRVCLRGRHESASLALFCRTQLHMRVKVLARGSTAQQLVRSASELSFVFFSPWPSESAREPAGHERGSVPKFVSGCFQGIRLQPFPQVL
jgi:hypothetical protein